MSLLQIIFKYMLTWTYMNFLLQKLKKFWVIIFTTKEILKLDFLVEIEGTPNFLHIFVMPLVVYTVAFNLMEHRKTLPSRRWTKMSCFQKSSLERLHIKTEKSHVFLVRANGARMWMWTQNAAVCTFDFKRRVDRHGDTPAFSSSSLLDNWNNKWLNAIYKLFINLLNCAHRL